MGFSHAETMAYSATKISAFLNGTETGTGTGFFHRLALENGSDFVMLVTNKHVIADADTIQISLHKANQLRGVPTGETQLLNIQFQSAALLLHPTADLCAIGVGKAFTELHRQGHPVFVAPTSSTDIPTPEEWADFDAIESITMVGCPRGLFDDVNGLPILRSGTTASHPGKMFQGKEEFLIDLACFPGSSGSPVYRYGLGPRWDRRADHYRLGDIIDKKLLGVLYSGPTINERGVVVLGSAPGVLVQSMMHIGQVIRSTAILDLEKLVLSSLG